MTPQRKDRARRPEPALDGLRPISGFRRVLRIVLTSAAAILICVFLDQKAFDYLEQYTYNLRLMVHAAHDRSAVTAAQQRILLVTLTDDAFATGALPGTPPVPRTYHAKVIRDLTRAGAKVIAFDLLFDTETPQDAGLASAARSSGRVLWACLRETNSEFEKPRWLLPNPRLLQASPPVGHCLVPQDVDVPIADRIEPVVIRDGRPIPSLSLEAAMMARGLGDRPIRRTRDGWQVGSLRIPVDESGCFRISYLGKPGETFASIPYDQVYHGAVDDEFYRKNRFFAGKIVLIGDATSVTGDHLYTSVGDMTGVEIHAHAIATLLQGRFVRESPPWINIAVISLMGGLVCLASCLRSLLRAALATVGLLVGFFLLNVWIFSSHGVWLHLVAPLAAMLAVSVGLLGERALIEELEKKRMRLLLRRYVSPEIAEYIIANPDACVLGGKRVTATVLFADIRDFTTVSEKLPPESVVERLNEFFEAMTEVAFAHDGTVDKYVGDAIMVLFGIPVPCPDHARRAVAAAIDMQTALLDLQTKWASHGLPAIDIGIGINTGAMVAGSIGSTQRVEFTVIGDDVNIAWRMQDLNKELGTRILVAQSTYEAVQEEVSARGPLAGRVKGKEFTAFEILGWRDSAQPPAEMAEEPCRPESRS